MPLSDTLTALVGTTEELSAIQICQELLRYCSEGNNYLEQIKGSGLGTDNLRNIVELLVARCHARMYPVDISNGEELVEEIKRIIEDRPFKSLNDRTKEDVAVAYAMAISLDQMYGTRWVSQLVEIYGKVEFEVNRNDVFPKSPPFYAAFARQLYGSARLTPSPEKRSGLGLRPERIALHESKIFRLTLNTQLCAHQFEIKTFTIPVLRGDGSTGYEEEESPWPRLATGLLNLWKELDWDRGKNRNNCEVIRNVGPRMANGKNCFSDEKLPPREIQKKRTLALLQKCDEMKIDVLVLPELCFDADLQDELVRMAVQPGQLGRYPSIVVLGSSHRCQGEGDGCSQKNLLKLVIRSRDSEGVVIDHSKFNPLTNFKDKKNGTVRDEQLDDTVTMIKMVVGEHFSLVPLICKDFLHEKISEIWPVMQPALILVPALSLVSGPFFDAARAAATSRIATVVADNGLDCTGAGQGDSSKKFAIFGLYGNDATGQSGVAFEENLTSQQKMPVIFCLKWNAEHLEPESAKGIHPCTVRMVPITQ